MHIRNSQTGRSMIETLGVLAVVGVLSVGGIAGYTYGMNKLRTNEIMDGANKRASTVAMQHGVRAINLKEFDGVNVVAGGTFASEIVPLDSQFGIKVTGVSKPVCENVIVLSNEENSLIRDVTNEALVKLAAEDCTEENTLVFVYNNDISKVDNSENLEKASCELSCEPPKKCLPNGE